MGSGFSKHMPQNNTGRGDKNVPVGNHLKFCTLVKIMKNI
jgi:hypothetical protein